jgi:integrase
VTLAAVKVETDFRYLLRDRDRHGNPRVYYRPPGGKMVRLRAAIGTQAFVDEYQRAKVGGTAASKIRPAKAERDSLRWLIEGYYQSANYKSLGRSTQRARRGILDHICLSIIDTPAGSKTRGTLPFAQMMPRHVRAIRDEKLDLPEAANGRIKALGQVFRWAIENDLADADPTATVDYLGGASEGFHTWTVEEVRQYEAAHPIGTKARLALALLLFTGVRRSDVVKLGRHMERDGVLHFTETKGANSRALGRKKTTDVKKRVLPILPELKAAIDATPSGELVYLVTDFGKPFTAAGFGNKFRGWCNAAGLKHCTAHGCRKAGAKMAAENGATAHQLMAIFGWETLRQAEVYTRSANRTLLAEQAMHLLVPREKNKSGA